MGIAAFLTPLMKTGRCMMGSFGLSWRWDLFGLYNQLAFKLRTIVCLKHTYRGKFQVSNFTLNTSKSWELRVHFFLFLLSLSLSLEEPICDISPSPRHCSSNRHWILSRKSCQGANPLILSKWQPRITSPVCLRFSLSNSWRRRFVWEAETVLNVLAVLVKVYLSGIKSPLLN